MIILYSYFIIIFYYNIFLKIFFYNNIFKNKNGNEKNGLNCRICGNLCNNRNSNKCTDCGNYFHLSCVESIKNNEYKCNICKGIKINNFQTEKKPCKLCGNEYEFKISCVLNGTKMTMIKNHETYCDQCYLFIQSLPPSPIISDNKDYSFSLSPTLRALDLPDDVILTDEEEEKKKKTDGKKKKSKKRKKSSTKRKKSLKYKSNRRK